MTWYHYSSNSLNEKLYNVNKQKNMNGKPCGFWLSYNNEWLEWCKSQEFYTYNPDNYYRYEYSLDKLNLYKISSIEELRAFQDKYAGQDKYTAKIDWAKVATEYDGIIFLNYSKIKNDLTSNFSMEMLYSALNCMDINDMESQIKMKKSYFDYMWFTLIDISCACIWNTDNLEIIGEVKFRWGTF